MKQHARESALWCIFTRIAEMKSVVGYTEERAARAEVMGCISMAYHVGAIPAKEMDYLYTLLFSEKSRYNFPFSEGGYRVYDDAWRSRYEAWLADGRLPTDAESLPQPEPEPEPIAAALAAAE
jgi:hypothetical protein